MPAPSITSADLSALRDILDLAERPQSSVSATAVTYEVLRLCERLFGADGASVQQIDSGARAVHFLQYVEAGEQGICDPPELAAMEQEEGVEVAWAHWWELPASLVERTGAPVATTTRSWYTAREWANHPAHVEYLNHADMAILGYPLAPFRSVRLLMPRERGHAYGDRERVLLRLLQPHLRLLLEAVGGSAPAEAKTLTHRQREVLRLAQLGWTNRAIGRSLGISGATVRKHLENAYQRLHVQSRTAAVALAFDPVPPAS